VTTAAIVVLALTAAFFFVASVGLHRQLQDERRLSKACADAAFDFKAAADKYAATVSMQRAQLDLLSKTPNKSLLH
jgi:hypothetical protein